MDCKKVEELLPLYVGRDLEEERARLVTAHVQACTQCARSAEEYGEANQLLQLFGPPEFSEATFAAVRSRVRHEIERGTSAPQSIFALEFLRRPFQPRVMWAVSTAVLFAVCVFAYYFIANRTNEQRHEQANASPHDKMKALPAPVDKDLTPELKVTTGGPPALVTHSPRSRLNIKTQTAWHPARAGGPPAIPVKSAQLFPTESKDAAANTSLTSEKTLRLEIQTSDRNIRIIWFSHPSTHEGSPNESSKGI